LDTMKERQKLVLAAGNLARRGFVLGISHHSGEAPVSCSQSGRPLPSGKERAANVQEVDHQRTMSTRLLDRLLHRPRLRQIRERACDSLTSRHIA
jgi:hypothetical protein